MTQPGFVSDTDAIRWYAVRCGLVADELDDLNQRVFGRDAVIDDRSWGGAMMYLTGLNWHLGRLGEVYEKLRSATVVRNGKIVSQLQVTEINLNRVAHAYDVSDQGARERFIR